jgi:hypothetical protein
MRFIMFALTLALVVSRADAQDQNNRLTQKWDPHPDSASRNNPAWDSAWVRQFEAKRKASEAARVAANTPANKAAHDSTMAVIRKKLDEMVAISEKRRRDSLLKEQTDTVSH